ncbi:Ubiquitin-like protein [Paecilomyces lecythidis]|uniref:Ubiquitin-like protein ATG12 n=1 Tax=Paecilomyces lecythidis TaxID=3004212 RepID=A0ABR3XN99_9EURO
MEPSSPSDRSARNSPNPSASGTGAGFARRPRSGTPSNEAATNNAGTTPIPDDEHGADLPLTMSASVVLTGLPRDAHQALADVEALDTGKVTVRFQPLPSAPILKNRVFKISASQKFETVVKFLRKKLDCKDTDSVFCYVNSVFAPGLDEGVGGLWRCFKTDDQLIVAYSMTPAFG